MNNQEKWITGIHVSFNSLAVPEKIWRDDFYKATWVDLPQSEEEEILSSPFQLNGVWRQANIAGWQCLDSGLAVLHPETDQEDMSLASGHLVMATVDGDRSCGVQAEYSPIPEGDLGKLYFYLAIATNTAGLEYVALHLLANVNARLPQLSILPGQSHSTMSIGKSWYFVLKHLPI